MDIAGLLGDELKKQALSQIVKKVGGDSQLAQSVVEKALPSILKKLEKNTSKKGWKEALDTALDAHMWETQINIEDGKKILAHIYGKNTEKKIGKIAEKSQISPEQSKDVMAVLSSLVLEKLGDTKKSGATMEDITSLLGNSGKKQQVQSLFDQDGDGDVDKNDAVKFGLGYIMKRFLGKK